MDPALIDDSINAGSIVKGENGGPTFRPFRMLNLSKSSGQ
jgi:hypothetical protein